ncbi:terminase large subunit domain-containing protein [Edaphovirga cremea]|uniref:terminase large subunit domain-containing protein n=1 Tax=Edaphovirga cremea TaxID=2267246 RepID=UPI003989CE0F
MARYSDEIKDAARSLYIKRWTPKDIARELNLPVRTIYHWSDKGQWDSMLPLESVEESLSRRINQLGPRENKTQLEIEEYQMLVVQHVKLMAQRNKHSERMEEIRAKSAPVYNDTGLEGGGGEGKRKYKKNDISGITAEMLDACARGHLFDYQLHCREHIGEDFRFILKCRQAGMTYYFAWEAFENAVLTGENQVFFSASRAQSEIFRQYIVEIALRHFGVVLTGATIRLSNGAILRFLSTNANTAQGYNGHLYGDEVFWIPKFTRLHEVASAMATHSKFRTTYFSTPSAKTHQAYGVWTGDNWRGDDAKRKNVLFPKFGELRDGGRLCPDGIWRYVITMEDAVAGGLGVLVDIERLRNRYSPTAFAMLYMCEFVDSKDAVFKFSELTRCAVDAGMWQDYDPNAARPFGNREVWCGFDPSRTGDNSTFVIVAPPMFVGERFRVLAVYQWQGLNFTWQAEQIKQLMRRYNVTHIGIDITGIGRGVYDLVAKFAPREANPILYSVESKARLVLKMIDTVERSRIEWSKDAQDEITHDRAEIIPSFMAIRRTTTKSGNAMTFVAERSDLTGHADVFFAIAHAVINEPLDYEYDRPSTWAFGKAA